MPDADTKSSKSLQNIGTSSAHAGCEVGIGPKVDSSASRSPFVIVFSIALEAVRCLAIY